MDLPFQINGNTVWVSVVVNYDDSTGQPVSYGCTVYGNNAPNSSSYVPATAYYSNNQMVFSGNMTYSYTTQTTYQAGGGLTGTGSIGIVGIEANANGNVSNMYTITQSGTIHVEASVNMLSAFGTGTIQLNGPSGPSFNFALEPN